MNCYVKDFGAVKYAICEEDFGRERSVMATERIDSEPTPEVWARLGAVLARSGEILEAQ